MIYCKFQWFDERCDYAGCKAQCAACAEGRDWFQTMKITHYIQQGIKTEGIYNARCIEYKKTLWLVRRWWRAGNVGGWMLYTG